MRILYFTRDDSVHDQRFLTTIAAAGHETLLIRLEGKRDAKRSLPQGVREIHWRGGEGSARWWNYPGLVKDLKRVIQEVKPDLVHAGPLNRSAFIAAQARAEPLVSMSWGSDVLTLKNNDLFLKAFTRMTLRKSSVFIGDCEAVKHKAMSFGFPEDRIVIFPWGVDLKQFSPGSGAVLRNRWNWQNRFILLSVRSWEPIYGVDELVKGFILAAKKNPEIRLILAGAGSQSNLLHRLIEEGGCKDKVCFLGNIAQSNLPALYRAADLYVSASHSDGSSVSLMETMACGKPVLVSNIAGNREWISEGENGWLFRDGDIEEMAKRMADISNSKKLKGIGMANRKLAEKKADWSKNSKKLFQAYEIALRKVRAT